MSQRAPYVLVVDDNKNMADLAIVILKMIGCLTEYATDGQQCLNICEVNKPDLILLDIMMPVKDGYTTAQELAQNPETRDIPIVIITAKGSLSEMVEESPNVVCTFEKPYDTNALKMLVRKILASKFSGENQ